jgi:hypothetical protein
MNVADATTLPKMVLSWFCEPPRLCLSLYSLLLRWWWHLWTPMVCACNLAFAQFTSALSAVPSFMKLSTQQMDQFGAAPASLVPHQPRCAQRAALLEHAHQNKINHKQFFTQRPRPVMNGRKAISQNRAPSTTHNESLTLTAQLHMAWGACP